jgi:hypothetical protein
MFSARATATVEPAGNRSPRPNEEDVMADPVDLVLDAVTAEDRERCRVAAARVREVHPGAVGALVERELRAYADFGYRFDADRMLPLLAADVLDGAARAGSTRAPS